MTLWRAARWRPQLPQDASTSGSRISRMMPPALHKDSSFPICCRSVALPVLSPAARSRYILCQSAVRAHTSPCDISPAHGSMLRRARAEMLTDAVSCGPRSVSVGSFSIPSSSSSLLSILARGAAAAGLRAASRALKAIGEDPKCELWKPSSPCTSRTVLTCPHLPRKRRQPGAMHVATLADEKVTME